LLKLASQLDIKEELDRVLIKHVENPFWRVRALAWFMLAARVGGLGIEELSVLSELGWARLQTGENVLVWSEIAYFFSCFLRMTTTLDSC
jgi:hypothetical protein